MSYNRYEIRQDEDGRYSIYEKSTGLVAMLNGVFCRGFTFEQAEDAVEILNWEAMDNPPQVE